jgi:hypothetical protein
MIRSFASAALAGFMLFGCTAEASKVQAMAEDSTRHFHELLAEGRYSDIYRDADTELRQSQSETSFVSYLRDAQAQLANPRASRQRHAGIVLERQYATVVLVYDVDVGDRTLSEEIWWRVRTQASLLDYHVELRSPP